MMTDLNTPAWQAGEPQPDAKATATDQPISPEPTCLSCLPADRGGSEPRRALAGWSPPDLAADTPVKRRADRLLPRSGMSALACFALVVVLFNLAPHLPVRTGLAVDGLAVLAGGAWCALNFWRCRHAHCLVTGAGWLALAVVAFAGAIAGHSLISGYEQPVFLVVLGVALAFEAAWRCARGTNAVGRLAAPPRRQPEGRG
jgi:hypothetical protein